ncbi:MAG: preprotein translocase subunit SecA [Patescibacteria group bacterium]|nr:preprotein translocase subunit SecA [Patescibacteria group bacterium]
MGFWDKLFGDPNLKIIKSLQPIVDKINSLEEEYQKKSDEELRLMTLDFKKRLGSLPGEEKDYSPEEQQALLDEILPEAFANIREASRRVLGQRHYDVQLIGGIVLHRGQIAEMKTGEGKTLVATLPLYLNALLGKGSHLVTVNDYLSRVGAGWMAPVYHALGLSTGVIVHNTAFIYDPETDNEAEYDERLKPFKAVSRKEAYDCDITYGTNNEFGFDYLRDNMVSDLSQMVQRDFYYSIVDEVDSILIDEARTPLIISAPAEESSDRYAKFSQLVRQLKEDEDYNIDEKMRAATLTENGIAKMEKWLGVENIYVAGGVKDVHNIEQALKANVLFKKDKDYVVKEGEIIIVDEFTGRMMPGRRYSEGLHQAIEAKEGVMVQRESQTLATVTFQNYFRMYPKLAGMTGTAVTEAEEFYKIYKLETVVIPTNKPNIRKDYSDLIYKTTEGKFTAVIKEVKERNALGQPILIGTVSIEDNEILGDMMEREGLHPNILNAKNHFREAEIIAQAGRVGAITVATNMAGRGVDIILGGNPAVKEEQEKVKELGGLHVIGTERHESRRIDNQLRGRAGRQGDPGSSQFYISAEDDLMRIFGGDRLKNIMGMLKLPEDTPIQNKIVSNSIESAQRRVEGNNFDLRKHVVEYDDVINKHREAIYKKRREILDIYVKQKGGHEADGRFLSNIILDYVENEITQIVTFHTASENVADWNLKEVYESVKTIYNLSEDDKNKILNITSSGGNKDDFRNELLNYLKSLAQKNYQDMREGFDGLDINFIEIEKGILIRSIDNLWIEHLETIDYLRRGIGLRGYGQRDPLVEYKKEAYHMYQDLLSLIQRQVVYSIYKTGDVSNFIAPSIIERAKKYSAPLKEMAKRAGGGPIDTSGTIDMARDKVKDESGNKVGRNDLCPCGSGKKFKKCCGA